MADSILVSAPARLHFGLFSVGQSLEYQFGGCGLMIDGPRTIVTTEPADRLTIDGPQATTARNTLAHWYQLNAEHLNKHLGIRSLAELPLSLTVSGSAPRHVGFGSGTQLALAVVTAAIHWLQLPVLSVSDLAVSADRAKRSAIGSYGFLRGGFLVDRGKKPGQRLAPLELRLDFPIDWPIVTVEPRDAQGLSGANEKQAFADLPDSSAEQRATMVEIVKSQIVPGIIDHNYACFSEGLYAFGYRSGMMFQSLQGGAYNGRQVQQIVDKIREFGVPAVGQSSWGPGIFAIAANLDTAESLVKHLRSFLPAATAINVRRADNQGAQVSTATKLMAE